MTMQRWDPFGEMLSLRQAMDRLMEDAFVWPSRSGGNQSGGGFPIDLSEHEDELILKASLPGVRPEDVNLSVRGNTITIEAEAREEHEQPQAEQPKSQEQQAKQGNGQQAQANQGTTSQPRYHFRERRYGRFYRHITLPIQVDSGKTEASFEHGVLTVTMPKAEEARQRRISVRSGPAQLASGGQSQQPAAHR